MDYNIFFVLNEKFKKINNSLNDLDGYLLDDKKSSFQNFGNNNMLKNKVDLFSVNNIEKKAKDWLGVKYKFGGETKKGIDCSAFIQKVFAPTKMERTARYQFESTKKKLIDNKPLNIENLQKGDLIFFSETYGKFGSNVATHVGIYLGDGKFIHASGGDKKGSVKISSLNDNKYWKSHYIGATRPLAKENIVLKETENNNKTKNNYSNLKIKKGTKNKQNNKVAIKENIKIKTV